MGKARADMAVLFSPAPDVATILKHLLDIYERRDGAPKQVVKVRLDELADHLPGYHSQVDPLPRLTSNEQLSQLAQLQWLRLTWQPGQTGHLLEAVALEPAYVDPLYTLLERQPLAEQRRRLREQLLGERFRLDGWRRRAVDDCLAQLQAHKSPAPFSLTQIDWNQDLLTILAALPSGVTTAEQPYRVFSVRLFNDSKRFELFKDSVARLARQHQPAWRTLSPQEVLHELGLVANPSHLYLAGPWQMLDGQGQVVSLDNFYPAVGIPAALAAQTQRIRVSAARVVCVENLASFYELIRYEGTGLAALCLWGNPSPVTRHLLTCLAQELPESVPLLLWADLDYGGLNILAHLRQHISPRFRPYRMDSFTLSDHAYWAKPLSPGDARNLARLRRHPALADMIPLIDQMLRQEIKLEQEAIILGQGEQHLLKDNLVDDLIRV
jgi:hypothetical protein